MPCGHNACGEGTPRRLRSGGAPGTAVPVVCLRGLHGGWVDSDVGAYAICPLGGLHTPGEAGPGPLPQCSAGRSADRICAAAGCVRASAMASVARPTLAMRPRRAAILGGIPIEKPPGDSGLEPRGEWSVRRQGTHFVGRRDLTTYGGWCYYQRGNSRRSPASGWRETGAARPQALDLYLPTATVKKVRCAPAPGLALQRGEWSRQGYCSRGSGMTRVRSGPWGWRS